MKQNILLYIFLVICFSFTQIVNAQGIIKDDFLVNNDIGSENQVGPSISMDPGGNFVIVWYDFRNDNWDIYFQRYNDVGTALGINTIVNDDTQDASQEHPKISMDAAGNFIGVWDDNRNNNFDIYFQRYTSAGGTLGVNIKVNDDVDSVKQWNPSISMDAAGNFVVVWIDERNGNRDIYFQRFTSTGAALGTNIKVNDDAGSMHQKLPSISMDAAGNFIIVWQDDRFEQTDHDIIGQRYFSNGNPNSGNYLIVANGPNNGVASPVVFADNSSIIFSWEDDRRLEGWDIYAKIVDWNWNGVTDVEINNNIPSEFSLSQNYPNPFNPNTKIKFTIQDLVFTSLKVYDILGKEVTTLVNEEKPVGKYEVDFDASDLISGIYFYQLKAGSFIQTKKMVFLK